MNAARSILVTGIFLFLFAVVGAGMVAFTYDSTRDRIAENERQALLRSLHAIIPEHDYDNDLARDVLVLPGTGFGIRQPVQVYRARHGGKPVAAIFATVAPDGYNGSIHLLVGIRADGRIAGVRAVSHQETPGLGDNIDIRKSPWVLEFNGKSLGHPPLERWKVKKDGGVFDQFTGATITPRAVVKAVRRALVYFKEHRQAIFSAPPPAPAAGRAGRPSATGGSP